MMSRFAPLAALALLVVVALGIEWMTVGKLLWLSKVPLAALLAVAALRRSDASLR